jgi:hypothetical protein
LYKSIPLNPGDQTGSTKGHVRGGSRGQLRDQASPSIARTGYSQQLEIAMARVQLARLLEGLPSAPASQRRAYESAVIACIALILGLMAITSRRCSSQATSSCCASFSDPGAP